jgi:hypothetical protein
MTELDVEVILFRKRRYPYPFILVLKCPLYAAKRGVIHGK